MRQLPRVLQIMVCAAFASVSVEAAKADVAPRTVELNRICGTVMGLTPGEAHFDRCVMSLADALAKQESARRIDRDRQACAARGLKPDTRDFAVCVLDASPKT